jgi:hypothetical protein
MFRMCHVHRSDLSPPFGSHPASATRETALLFYRRGLFGRLDFDTSMSSWPLALYSPL